MPTATATATATAAPACHACGMPCATAPGRTWCGYCGRTTYTAASLAAATATPNK